MNKGSVCIADNLALFARATSLGNKRNKCIFLSIDVMWKSMHFITDISVVLEVIVD